MGKRVIHLSIVKIAQRKTENFEYQRYDTDPK